VCVCVCVIELCGDSQANVRVKALTGIIRIGTAVFAEQQLSVGAPALEPVTRSTDLPLDAFTWAYWRNSLAFIVDVAKVVDHPVGMDLIKHGIEAGEMVHEGFLNTRVDNLGTRIDEASARHGLPKDMCIFSPSARGKEVCIGTHGGGNVQRVQALGLALAIVVAVDDREMLYWACSS
jgi:hypothetical protein